jgi:hypothetical protein
MAIMIDVVFFFLILDLVFQAILVEYRWIAWVRVLNAKDAMSPAVLENAISLTKENLLSLHGIELLKLIFDFSELGSSLYRCAKISRVN